MPTKGSLQVQVTVPSYFVCPISLELMCDPVTISSGQTFDRASIHTPHLTKLLSRSFSGLAPLTSSLATVPTPRSLSKADEALLLLDLLIDPTNQSLADQQKLFCDEELVLALANSLLRTIKSDSRLKSASTLLKLQLSDPLKRKMGKMQGFMGSLVAMIKEDAASCRVALRLLLEVCSGGSCNRVSATEAGAMGVLAELLVNGQGYDRATVEIALKDLYLLCQCAEGRTVAASDTSILAAVMRQMTFVSERASHYAVHIVLLVTKWAPESSKVKSLMVKEGALLKASTVAQSAAAHDTRVAARKLVVSLSSVLPHGHLLHTMRLR